MTTPIITPQAFNAARSLCLLANLRVMTFDEASAASHARRGRPDFARTMTHECGHGGAYLDRSHGFSDLFVRADGSGALSPLAGKRRRPPPPERWGSLDARVASELGGVVAEMVILGSVEPYESIQDMQRAFARADGDAAFVREQVRRLTSTFQTHRGALRHMADALRRSGRLDHAQCMRLARDAGWPVQEPRFEPFTPPGDERARLDALDPKPRASAAVPRADADADEDAEAKSSAAVAEIRSDPARYRKLWAERARTADPLVTEAQVEASWQKFCDHIGLATPEADR